MMRPPRPCSRKWRANAWARKNGPQVDVQHLIIIVRLRVEERRVPLHTGIVDQDVQLPHLRDALAHQPMALLDVTDIRGDEAHPPAQGADLLKALAGLFVVLAAVDDNVGSLFSQAHGNAAADALGAAGDQSHLILQAHCHPPHADPRAAVSISDADETSTSRRAFPVSDQLGSRRARRSVS